MDSKHAEEKGFKKIPNIKTIGELKETTEEMIALIAIKKAQKAAFIFELLCKELGVDPFAHDTTWHVIATQYKNTMEEMSRVIEKQNNDGKYQDVSPQTRLPENLINQ